MLANSVDYGEHLRSNIAEQGQIWTSSEWYHPLLVSNAGTFPHVSAMGTCTLGLRILRCFTFVTLPFEVQENLLHPWIFFLGITCIQLKEWFPNTALESLLPKLAGCICRRAQLKASPRARFQPTLSCSKQLQAVAALQQQLVREDGHIPMRCRKRIPVVLCWL